MSQRFTLTPEQRREADAGRFVRLGPAFGSVIVARIAGAWVAYANECRHRALPLDLGARSPMSDDGSHILCHQHGALYRLTDGKCIAGPCTGESLTSLAVHEDGDTLEIG